jgi:acetyltransferase-like isoleucine patch superfamily enzyme
MNNLFQSLKNLLKSLNLFEVTVSIYNIITFKFISISGINFFFQAFKLYIFNDLVTKFPIHFVRLFYLKKIIGVKIGNSCFIHMGVRFEGNIELGNNTVIGRNCILKGDIIIKNNVSVTAETYIFTSSHIVNNPDFSCFYKNVIIEDYAWIGARATIFPGVRIGKGAVLGATSTATKDIPDYAIFAGIPAKQIGVRSTLLNYKLEYFPFFQ